MIWVILTIVTLYWFLSGYIPIELSWDIALIVQCILTAIVSYAWLLASETKSILHRSVITCITLFFIITVFDQALWLFTDYTINTGLVLFTLMLACFLNIVMREYDLPNDKLNTQDIFILLLKPRSRWEVLKALIGIPVASVCIYYNGYVWAFRSSGKYQLSHITPKLINNHTIINTGYKKTDEIIELLNSKIGNTRGLGIKCIYEIRDILTIMGLKPKTLLHYIPSIYVSQLRR